MSKYIDAEKLITIIEERKAQQDQWVNSYHDPINQGISQELTEILSITTSLQQEQPEISKTEVVESEATINGIKTKLNTIIFVVSDDLKPGDKVEAIITRKEESK